MKKLTGHALLWGGAAISIAEIETGLAMAPMASGNWSSALAAIIPGHLIGGLLLFAAGAIGARTRKNAMETAAIPFGVRGAKFFAAANVLQLLGWTAVMIAQGATAATCLFDAIPYSAFCIAIGFLIALWLCAGNAVATRLGSLAVVLLAIMTALLTARIALAPSSPQAFDTAAATGFWPMFELSIAMPLSWLPLISDYTKDAEHPWADAAVSAIVYTLISIWMYALGFAVGTSSQGQSFAAAVASCGMGAVGLFVIIFSTVTTTFLDAFSAGESAVSIAHRLSPRWIGLAACALGILMAIAGIMDRYVDFLYLIAAVFAPMAAVQLADWLLFSRHDAAPTHSRLHLAINLAAWAVGFALCQLMPAAGTLTAMAASAFCAACGAECARHLKAI